MMNKFSELMASPPTLSSTSNNRTTFSMNGLASYLPALPSNFARRLMSFKKESEAGNEDVEKAEKAVKSLVKKLKKPSLLELERVLSSEGGYASNCITLPFVKKQKLTNHLYQYCRLWRWPDLQHYLELRSISICHFGYNQKKEEICINPYHYTRVENPALSPVYVHKLNEAEITIPPPENILPINRQYLSDTPPCPDETPPPAYSESIDSPSMCSGVGSPLLSPSSNAGQQQLAVSSNYGCYNDAGIPADVQQIVYVEPPNWCSIAYYELDRKVSEEFKATKTVINVDGGTDPSSRDRFCLGSLCNAVRDDQIKQTRQHIGQGLMLYYAAGEVYIECLSRCSIFVNSQNYNLRSGWHPSTVVKVPTGCLLNLFNSQDFARRLTEAVYNGFSACYAMQNQCKIHVSFVKGWGAEYRRSKIIHSPCWIEITLTGPLQWLDKVLTKMAPEGAEPHSNT